MASSAASLLPLNIHISRIVLSVSTGISQRNCLAIQTDCNAAMFSAFGAGISSDPAFHCVPAGSGHESSVHTALRKNRACLGSGNQMAKRVHCHRRLSAGCDKLRNTNFLHSLQPNTVCLCSSANISTLAVSAECHNFRLTIKRNQLWYFMIRSRDKKNFSTAD